MRSRMVNLVFRANQLKAWIASVALAATACGAGPGAEEELGEVASALCSPVTISANPPSPQQIGASIALTANAICGSGQTAEYLFLFRLGSAPYQQIGNWSTSNTASWSTAGLSPGNYTVTVRARAQGSSGFESQASLATYYMLGDTCSSVSLATTPASPQPLNTALTLSATPVCQSAPEFEFSYRAPGSSTFTVFRSWGPSTAPLPTTGFAAGVYKLRVLVRPVSNPSAINSAAQYYSLGGVCKKPISLTSSLPSPQPAGTTINLTGAATCSDGATGEYQFSYRPAGVTTWSLIRAWGPSVASWNTTGIAPGAYQVQVEARGQGHLGAAESSKIIGYTLGAGACPPNTPGGIVEFPVPTPTTFTMSGITAGPDGNLWFTESGGSEGTFIGVGKIGRITPCGAITEFPTPNPFAGPLGIVAGPDGNLWFTEWDGNSIGKITLSGVITEFPVLSAFSNPVGITLGPDNALWFTMFSGENVGRIDTAGVVTEFPAVSGGRGITAGPDGNLWFAVRGATDEIGRMTTAGTFTSFPLPPGSDAFYIVSGPDGNLWFTEPGPNKIGRMTPVGSVTEFPIPTAGSFPTQITTGSDGNLWFLERTSNKVARITTAGVITEFPLPTAAATPFPIAAGPDGNVWFTEGGANKVGRIVPP
jgi:streptogramin lyase